MLAPGVRRIDPGYVARVLELGYPPHSPYLALMRGLRMPPQTLLLRRMEVQLLALLGDLHAAADWGAIAAEHHAGAPASTPLGREDHARPSPAAVAELREPARSPSSAGVEGDGSARRREGGWRAGGGPARSPVASPFEPQESLMPTRVAINGFGRVGRALMRSAHESGAGIEIVAINDVTDAATLAPLLRHDSVYGRSRARSACDGAVITVDGREIPVLGEQIRHLPWADLGWRSRSSPPAVPHPRGAGQHLHGGRGQGDHLRPRKGAEPVDADLVLGVNFDEVYDPESHRIVTNASCTTNCLAPVAKVLHETVGIRHGLMTTVHAYTADQNLLDGPHKDLRRARAGAINLVPTSTGAAKAVGRVIPELQGKLHGYRRARPAAPPARSWTSPSRPSARRAWTRSTPPSASARTPASFEGILAYSEEPLVATDIVGSPLLVRVRRAAHERHRRHPGQGRGLVRQRMGLLDPARGARRRRRWRRPRRRSARRVPSALR